MTEIDYLLTSGALTLAGMRVTLFGGKPVTIYGPAIAYVTPSPDGRAEVHLIGQRMPLSLEESYEDISAVVYGRRG